MTLAERVNIYDRAQFCLPVCVCVCVCVCLTLCLTPPKLDAKFRTVDLHGGVSVLRRLITSS